MHGHILMKLITGTHYQVHVIIIIIIIIIIVFIAVKTDRSTNIQ